MSWPQISHERTEQSVGTALVPEGEALVIDAKLLHEGGVEVVNSDFVAQDRAGEVVDLAVNQARLEVATGHQDGEAVGMVIASLRGMS